MTGRSAGDRSTASRLPTLKYFRKGSPRQVIAIPGYIPALRFRILTLLYDSFMRITMKEIRLKTLLVSRMAVKTGESVLDFGCGTGTLCLMIRHAVPGCTVTGIDIDPAILAIARRKAEDEDAGIAFVLYDCLRLPFPENSFDAVVSTFVVHHLPKEDKPRLFREIFRIGKPGGGLFVMDFGPPRTRYAQGISKILKHLEPIGDNLRGGIPVHLEHAGFRNIRELFSEETIFGTVWLWQAEKSAVF